MVLVAPTVLLAMARQPSWSKATAAPVMPVLLSGGAQRCSSTERAARGGLSALLIEGYCRASDARPPVCLEARNGARALVVLLAVACQPFWSKTAAAPVVLVLLYGGAQWCSCTD
jgi:hypothetical protein